METQTPKSIIKSINLTYWGLFISLIFLLLIFVYLIQTTGRELNTQYDTGVAFIVKTFVILAVIMMIPFSFIFPQRMISGIKQEGTLVQKLLSYRTALLIRYGSLNMAGSLVLVAFFLIVDTNLLILLAIILLMFIVFRPNLFKIVHDLQLSPEEKEEISIRH
jgi:hypothetical protein